MFGCFDGIFRDPQQWDPLMVSFPYYSHTTPIRIPKDMGMVCEASHKGGPIVGGPWKIPLLFHPKGNPTFTFWIASRDRNIYTTHMCSFFAVTWSHKSYTGIWQYDIWNILNIVCDHQTCKSKSKKDSMTPLLFKWLALINQFHHFCNANIIHRIHVWNICLHFP